MSNYELKAKQPDHTVSAGWDPMLDTFFAHVIDTTKSEDDDNRDVYWVGCSYQEIPDLQGFLKELGPYVQLTEKELNDITAALSRDAD